MDSDECCTVNAVVAVAILVSLSLEERWAGGGGGSGISRAVPLYTLQVMHVFPIGFKKCPAQGFYQRTI